MITFNSILADIRTPGQYIEFDGSKALKGLAALPHVALIVAPRLTTGTVAAATPFQITSGPQAELAFGRGSIGSFMAKAFKKANPYTEVWGIGVADNGAGVAASGVLTFTGTSTAAGTLCAYIGGTRIPVAIPSGTSAAAALLLLIAEMANYELPVTGVDGTGDTIDLTARNTGTTGNDIDVRFNYADGEVFPTGLSATVSTPMASGATNGSISGAITAMGDVQYHTIVSAWALDADLDLFEAELLDRWGPMEQKAGHLFTAAKGSQGTMTTAGNARNSFNSTLMGSALSPTPSFVWAAVTGALDAMQCSIDPSRPRTGLELVGCLPPAKASILTRAERNILLTDGVSTFTVDAAGKCHIERLITTYQTTASIADVTYLDIMTPRLLDALRYTQRARIALKFPRHKLADDDTLIPPGQAIVQPKSIKSELIALAGEWREAGWVEGIDDYIESLIVERNASDRNRIDVLQSPDLINAFFVFAGNMQFIL